MNTPIYYKRYKLKSLIESTINLPYQVFYNKHNREFVVFIFNAIKARDFYMNKLYDIENKLFKNHVCLSIHVYDKEETKKYYPQMCVK